MRLAIFSLLFSFLLLPLPAVIGQGGYSVAASKDDQKKLKEGVQAMHEAMVAGDVDVIVDKTYPLLIEFSGGKENFRDSVRLAINQLKIDGMKFESYQLGEPSKMHLSGSEWVCFVPEVSVAEIQGKRFRSTGFVIGVRSGSSTKWKFLEGVRLKKDPEALWRLFPGLPKTIELPPIKQELLEGKAGTVPLR